MTPIKVGPYTVRQCTFEAITGGGKTWAVYGIFGNGHGPHFRTLPMALRAAAEAAGIERQRVAWVPSWRRWLTEGRSDVSTLRLSADEDWRDVSPTWFNTIATCAHEYARARYAGGAA
jgi:hypothetical protein